jgi:excinuclease ABC subunit A
MSKNSFNEEIKKYNSEEVLSNLVFTPNPNNYITVRGAREHNLKNISLVIPKNKLVVFSGLSGSGKSSLVFDTIYAEGQRRYVESLSSYARQFLGLKEKPQVNSIDGLSPAISIDQKSTSHNPRSTVGTTTEIYDYLRLLFSKVGIQHCPLCDALVSGESVTQIVGRILDLEKETRIIVLSPVVFNQKGWHKQQIIEIKKFGFKRVRVDGKIILIEEAEKLDLNKQEKHSIEIVIDRLTISQDNKQRLIESTELALKYGKDKLIILNTDSNGNEKTLYYNKNKACPNGHGTPLDTEPRSFSFNSPHGACATCTGLGIVTQIDIDLVIPSKTLSIMEGCIRPLSQLSLSGGWLTKTLDLISNKLSFKLTQPWQNLSKIQQDSILYGYEPLKFEGVIKNLERRYKETASDSARRDIETYMTKKTCPDCNGSRLNKDSLAVYVCDRNISEITSLSISDSYELFIKLLNGEIEDFSNKDYEISKMILKEITSRLNFLINVGLGYLTLGRSADTLSGGEAQRIRLATQIGSGLTGVLYILDEPSIGLHQRDNMRLLQTLKYLRDLGNSVLVVEHDEDTIRMSDYLVDVGPVAGKNGGRIVSMGTPEEVMNDDQSPTGRFLSGKDKIEIPKNRRLVNISDSLLEKSEQKFIQIKNVNENNVKNVNMVIPLRRFVSITGVSGSGKSTIINDILSNYLMNYFYDSHLKVGNFESIHGLENIDKPIIIDQSPIGRTPRSNPATYTGLFTPIRELFAEIPESKSRGYTQGRFSFNVPGGRCETCQGDGAIKVEMSFLPDVYVVCEDCKGKRYNRETLDVIYREKNISDILNMTVEEAAEFFSNHKLIKRKLDTLMNVGLGYITLGQSATTLSGGEAQRIKLATELSKIGTGNTLYILDEPTTGLHPLDVKLLLSVLDKLVDKGNTVLVIEHNLDVIKTADWVIDLGPEGGDKGGEIVAVGTPEEICKVKESYTGQFLKNMLYSK